MATQWALTTVDNPYDPFDEFLEWLEYDRAAGYNTSDYLGRVVITSDELSESLQAEAVSQAIDDVIDEHGDSLYRKVSRTDDVPSLLKLAEASRDEASEL